MFVKERYSEWRQKKKEKKKKPSIKKYILADYLHILIQKVL